MEGGHCELLLQIALRARRSPVDTLVSFLKLTASSRPVVKSCVSPVFRKRKKSAIRRDFSPSMYKQNMYRTSRKEKKKRPIGKVYPKPEALV
jgi:hypothetical protein